ncbi:uncharacterized protein NEMAJ01_1783 [Nematocida major]|uniref:uncharacterized protein n=1 Tax=Nematocida major TaxID=1912982 RepID=UPI0020072BDF|nr:uncharacterized protein NEMAJ01_1783 [Nematocida major]KAH9386887.1 hypothetical protein NEMAJ01_1783 [Nematocida major]
MPDKNNSLRQERRMQAIHELFESESHYVYDLVLWTRTIKHLVVNTTTLDVYSKQLFLSNVIGNLDSIFEMHDAILIHFMRSLKISRNTPKDVFLRLSVSASDLSNTLHAYMARKDVMASAYAEYASKIPQATKTMNMLMENNPEFEAEIMDVLHRINRLHLGCSHFILRPMQKIARYPLLLRAILKYALPEEESALSISIAQIEKANNKVNQNVQYSTEYFTLYHLSHELKYKERPEFSIGMMQKDRKLIRMEEEMTIITPEGRKSVSMVILDNAMFFVECMITVRGMHKRTQKTLFDHYMEPSTISVRRMESTGKEETQLEVSSEGRTYFIECKEWEGEELEKTIKSIKIAQQAKFYNFTVEEMCNVVEGEKDVWLCLINPQPMEAWNAKALGDLAVGTEKYLEVILRNDRVRVVNKKTASLVYSRLLSHLFFMMDRSVYSIRIHGDLARAPVAVDRVAAKTEVSFVKSNPNPSENNIFLVAKRKGYLGSEELLIYKLSGEANGKLSKSVHKRMYIAGSITDVTFLGKNMVISSNDFELIDLVDLTTQELLDPLDKTIALYVGKPDSRPITMMKVEENQYLVAFDDVGFYINRYGTRKKANVVFLWLMRIDYVFIFKEFVVAIGKKRVKIFTLQDGIMRGIFPIANGKHLKHPDHILIYNDTNIYRINCP